MTPRPDYIRAALHRALTWAEDHPTELPPLVEHEDDGRCARGHELTRRANGRRECKPCRNARQRERRQRT